MKKKKARREKSTFTLDIIQTNRGKFQKYNKRDVWKVKLVKKKYLRKTREAFFREYGKYYLRQPEINKVEYVCVFF